jgi:putative multiple sugar transport system permease protein
MLVFKGLSLALLQGQSVGPFPVAFQKLSSGFIPDVFGGTDLRVTSLLIGLGVAIALLYVEIRGRMNQSKHGMEDEPYPFFIAKILLFAAIIIYFSYLLASYKGLPQCVDHHVHADGDLQFCHQQNDHRAAHLRPRWK